MDDYFKKWKEKHNSKGYKKFISDGIINVDRWNKTAKDKKVCFFLKEAYSKNEIKDWDLRIWLNSGVVKKLWHVVSDWVYAIENVTKEHIPAYTDIGKSIEEESERIKRISVVNIKKSEGTSKSQYESLIEFLIEDADLLKRQIKEIAPQIIICGGTAYYFQILYGAECDDKGNIINNAVYNGVEINKNELESKGYIWINDILIIDFCHPANRFERKGKYYAFAALYQQAIKDRE